MSTKRNLPGGKGRPALKPDNLTTICEPIVQEMWKPWRLTTYGPPRPVTGITSLFTFFIYWEIFGVGRVVSHLQERCPFRLKYVLSLAHWPNSENSIPTVWKRHCDLWGHYRSTVTAQQSNLSVVCPAGGYPSLLSFLHASRSKSLKEFWLSSLLEDCSNIRWVNCNCVLYSGTTVTYQSYFYKLNSGNACYHSVRNRMPAHIRSRT
jgi:hypothetical protein